ncbi:unnamed protein product [Amoebophrya sp. A25]|nr:unnamed protein product [Amoebophrya sp. A25]|eukprot:GSA25T00010534001.1
MFEPAGLRHLRSLRREEASRQKTKAPWGGEVEYSTANTNKTSILAGDWSHIVNHDRDSSISSTIASASSGGIISSRGVFVATGSDFSSLEIVAPDEICASSVDIVDHPQSSYSYNVCSGRGARTHRAGATSTSGNFFSRRDRSTTSTTVADPDTVVTDLVEPSNLSHEDDEAIAEDGFASLRPCFGVQWRVSGDSESETEETSVESEDNIPGPFVGGPVGNVNEPLDTIAPLLGNSSLLGSGRVHVGGSSSSTNSSDSQSAEVLKNFDNSLALEQETTDAKEQHETTAKTSATFGSGSTGASASCSESDHEASSAASTTTSRRPASASIFRKVSTSKVQQLLEMDYPDESELRAIVTGTTLGLPSRTAQDIVREAEEAITSARLFREARRLGGTLTSSSPTDAIEEDEEEQEDLAALLRRADEAVETSKIEEALVATRACSSKVGGTTSTSSGSRTMRPKEEGSSSTTPEAEGPSAASTASRISPETDNKGVKAGVDHTGVVVKLLDQHEDDHNYGGDHDGIVSELAASERALKQARAGVTEVASSSLNDARWKELLSSRRGTESERADDNEVESDGPTSMKMKSMTLLKENNPADRLHKFLDDIDDFMMAHDGADDD